MPKNVWKENGSELYECFRDVHTIKDQVKIIHSVMRVLLRIIWSLSFHILLHPIKVKRHRLFAVALSKKNSRVYLRFQRGLRVLQLFVFVFVRSAGTSLKTLSRGINLTPRTSTR